MSRDDVYLLDILESAKVAVRYVRGKTRAEFDSDMQCQDAVMRRLEIIGEAASRISQETRNKLPHLPWQEMKSTRNVAIHEYDAIEYDIVWDTVQNDLPMLVSTLEKIIPPEE